MNILVLGASGMAGHVVSLYLREQGHLVDTVSGSNKLDKDTTLLDVRDLEALRTFLINREYDVVVNCVALLVKESEMDKVLASELNTLLPLFLEKFYNESSTKVVQVSTDGVFSGNKIYYEETDIPDGSSFYGRSKALGELINNKDFTIRLSIIGPSLKSKGAGLFHWFMNQSNEINGFTNVEWSGITTIELAKAIEKSLKQNITGLYHLAPEESISKYKLLEILNSTFNRANRTIKPTKGNGINTIIKNTRKDFDYTIPPYQVMAFEMKEWIKSHPNIYKHYA